MSNNDLIEVKPLEFPAGALWKPVVGEETLELTGSQNNLSELEKKRLRDESVSILAQCVSPSAKDAHHSGLVIGNIQSGKTLSFATVAALARDNKYRLVIVITGTSKILNRQSAKRLKSLLRIGERSDFAWRLLQIQNPEPNPEPIKALLEDWRSSSALNRPQQTLIITVLKNVDRLEALAQLLGKLDLQGIPALVIDDEADQAGLNTAVNQGSESSTHHKLRNIRKALPHHTYLGYTATPQAPLLINVMDILSAKFVQVLTPGTGYTGGKEFFEHSPSLIRTIPYNQIPSKENKLDGPPESMTSALRIFFVGVAAGMILDSESQQEGSRNRSMLIHPSRRTDEHAKFSRWVRSLKSSWHRLLGNNDATDRKDRDDLTSDFQQAYDDLKKTAPDIPQFDQILSVLDQAVNSTEIHQINQRPDNQFPDVEDIDEFWGNCYSHILVGGQSLERGFTVEGLTITYMPRSIGTGQADTIQQRARFYGYNRKHLGYCRVYLDNDANKAYKDYIDHEDQLRDSLAKHAAAGKPLSEWRRMFFLDHSLKPTRDNVLDIGYFRGGTKADVPYAAMPPIYSIDDLEENRSLIKKFKARLHFFPDTGDPRRTVAQRHKVAKDVPIKDALEELIVPLKIGDRSDIENYFAIRLEIQHFLESPLSDNDCTCTVYLMRPGVLRFERTLREENKKIETYQGHDKKTGYEGDRSIFDEGKLTIQIYQYTSIKDRGENVLATDVPQIAIILPHKIVKAMVVQKQGAG